MLSNMSLQLDYNLMNQISDIIGYYLISAVSLIGFLLNAILIKVLSNEDLLRKHKFYKYILIKSICDWLVCLVGIGYLNNACTICDQITQNKYSTIVYELYMIKIPMRIAIVSSVWSEIYLNYNIYSILSGRKSFLTEIPLKYYLTVIFAGPVIISIPGYFAWSIYPTNSTDIYTFSLNSFGQTQVFSFYYLLLIVIESVIPVCLLFVFSVMSILKFKQIMKKIIFPINILTRNLHRKKKMQLKFTKMILILTAIVMLAHIADLLSALSYRLLVVGDDAYSPQIYSLVNFGRTLVFFILYLQYSIGIFIYTSNDKNIYLLVRKLFNRLVS